MHISRIAIVSIPVSDQKTAQAFYQGRLGFKVVSDQPMGPGQRWIELAPTQQGTTITLVTWFEEMPPGSVQGLVLETEDIAADYEELRAKGIEVSSIEEAEWGKFATFSDPDGNGWVLVQSPDA